MLRHEYGAVSPITKLSDVSSGGESPMTHAGKSSIGILFGWQEKHLLLLIFFILERQKNDLLTHSLNQCSPEDVD